MAGSDSSPSFDWLHKEMSSGIDGAQPQSGGESDSTSDHEQQENPGESVLDDMEENAPDSLPDETLEKFPAPELNESDGSTKVLPSREVDALFQAPDVVEPPTVQPPPVEKPPSEAGGDDDVREDIEKPVLSQADDQHSRQESPSPESDGPAMEANSSSDSTETPKNLGPNDDMSSPPQHDDSPQIAPPPPRTSQTPNEQASTPSNLPFIILASYASLVTLLLLMQFFSSGGAPNTKQLESLPDVAPEAPDKLSFISPDKPLPPGHTLTIGTEQRFGHILVEPLRVVHEPIEFVHYSDPTKTREPSQAVCKLWVRFTNVSDDQVISPLDAKLLLRWVVNSQLGERSNYYIAEPHGVATQATTYQYRLSKVDSWDMKGQSLGKELGPGETWETYICSEEIRLEELPESMVWRFQIRKGFSPKNHGVTTMVEVPFSKSDLG